MAEDLVRNRSASFHYELLETFEAGIALVGTEVKSLREHHGSLAEAYVMPQSGELFLLNCMIPHYKFGNLQNHEEKRPRKLLMHHREIRHLSRSVQEKGMTLVPIAFYLSKSHVKLKFALARGKQLHDKRSALREKDQKRDLQQTLKSRSND
ncbi:MAG: SsrA-binding protein SmpB [Chlamydiia bacterium]